MILKRKKRKKKRKKVYKKGRHKDKTPTNDLLRKKSHCGYFGNFNPAQHLSFGCLPQIQVERIGARG
jgi:hypothetical protein